MNAFLTVYKTSDRIESKFRDCCFHTRVGYYYVNPLKLLILYVFSRYIFGSVNQNDLAAYYRDADVALITPLRDGMNLVAKEFVACQNDENPGVLVLSPFAGKRDTMFRA